MRPWRLLLGSVVPGAVTLWLATASGTPVQQPALVTFARAYNAAWNAHDLDAALAYFAPDAIVRHRDAAVPEDVWATEATVQAYQERPGGEQYGLYWVRGKTAIGALIGRAFGEHARTETSNYHVVGETVVWQYRLRQDPFQQLPGVEPVAGTAEAVVRGGKIIRLSTVDDTSSIRQRQRALTALLARPPGTLAIQPPGGRAPSQDAPRLQARRIRDGAESTTPAWPLALGSLAALGYLVAVVRRHALRC